jgi:hypothetical protein
MAVVFGTSSTTTSAAGGWTIPKPTGLAVGDLMVACLSTHGGSVTLAGPAGWDESIPEHNPSASVVITSSVWTKIADAADVAAANFAFTSTGSSRGAATISRWTGHDTTTPVEATATNPASSTSTATHVAAAANGTTDGALVCFYAQASGAGDPWTAFTGSTGKAAELDSGGNTSAHQSLSVQYLLLSSTGSTGSKTSTSSAAAIYTGLTLTIRPPGGGGTVAAPRLLASSGAGS